MVTFAFLFALLFHSQSAMAQRVAFKDVQIHFNSKDRKQVVSSGSLVFEDTSRKILIESGKSPAQIGYDDVARVVFDWRLRIQRRGIAKDFGLSAATDLYRTIGGRSADTIDNRLDATAVKELTDRVMIIETNAGSMSPLVEIRIDDADSVVAKAKQIFGTKVYDPNLQIGSEIDKKNLADAKSKHAVTRSKNHPEPQMRPDKALIVVACPKPNIPGSSHWQMKLHANDSVVAVNQPGTYSFAYVDPGEYLLASQAGFLAGNANGFKMKLEAGHDYYFVQNITAGNRTILSANPKAIVFHEIGASSFSDWKRK